jgi:hypothetical protein
MPRRLPPLNALKAFEAAARHASFTRAAEELCVTATLDPADRTLVFAARQKSVTVFLSIT